MASPTNDKDDDNLGSQMKKDAEAAAKRVGEDLARAKENIAQAASSAREDIADDLRRLSDDVASLKDTVAKLAQAVGAELGSAAGGIGAGIASSAKDQASTLVGEIESVARRNPLGVIAGALCVGMLIGMLRGRR